MAATRRTSRTSRSVALRARSDGEVAVGGVRPPARGLQEGPPRLVVQRAPDQDAIVSPARAGVSTAAAMRREPCPCRCCSGSTSSASSSPAPGSASGSWLGPIAAYPTTSLAVDRDQEPVPGRRRVEDAARPHHREVATGPWRRGRPREAAWRSAGATTGR